VLGKRSKERVVPLGSHAVRTLREWFDDGRPELVPRQWRRRDDAEAVFLGVRGTRLSRQAVWQLLQQHGLRAGVPVQQLSPHVLRHSCATHLLDHGADIRSVQELLGHASIGTTQRYTKVATERLWQAYLAAHPRAGAATAGAGS
ncbi:MAG: tyrosine-type recombinase/integrase, partial [Microthrixaceae bacterium]